MSTVKKLRRLTFGGCGRCLPDIVRRSAHLPRRKREELARRIGTEEAMRLLVPETAPAKPKPVVKTVPWNRRFPTLRGILIGARGTKGRGMVR